MNKLAALFSKALGIICAVMLLLVIGSCIQPVHAAYYTQEPTYTVCGTVNYLALRTEARYDERNEIGKLYNGETVCPAGTGYNGYLYVYSPKLNMYGYVNARYVSSYTPSPVPAPNYCPGYSCTVTGTTHYLALRSAAAYDERNEIGRLYNGQTVEYINSGNGNYVYVYAPTLNAYGYVNRNYLCPFV